MLLLYNLIINIYALAIRLASPFNEAAKLWLSERVANEASLATWRNIHSGQVVWIHCASHGEYEQALPLIEQIGIQQRHLKIALTFFSPSGYRAVGQTAPVDWVGYMPIDSKSSMTKFISLLQPDVAIFVKNEWWWNALTILLQKNIPTHTISSTIRSDHYFVKYGWTFIKKVLSGLSSVGTVNKESKRLLQEVHPNVNAYVSGDLRIDRVEQVAREPSDHWLEDVLAGRKCIIYGSVWASDIPAIELLIKKYKGFKHVLFPHKLDDASIDSLANALGSTLLVSTNTIMGSNVVHVDKMGLLSKAYRYGTLAYVGGGFGAGIHNVLEAAVYGIPVMIGPRHNKSIEAVELIRKGSIIALQEQLDAVHLPNLADEELLGQIQKINRAYFASSRGATDITYNHIFGESHKSQP